MRQVFGSARVLKKYLNIAHFPAHLLEATVLVADSQEVGGIFLSWGSVGKERLCSRPVLPGTHCLSSEGLSQVSHPVHSGKPIPSIPGVWLYLYRGTPSKMEFK